ncbi:MAG: hypothetical protein ACRD3W_19220 [Terriglobales bacterium]
MKKELLVVVENQLEPGERVIWSGHPSAESMTLKIFSAWLLLVSCVYAESVSMLTSGSDGADDLLAVRVAAMIGFVAIGIFQLLRAPSRAAGIIYVLTDRRVMKLDLNKHIHPRYLAPIRKLHKAIVYEKRTSAELYWFSGILNVILFTIWLTAFLPSIVAAFDVHMALAVSLLAVFCVGYLYDQRYIIDARCREADSVMYWIDGRLVLLQDIRFTSIVDVKMRRGRSGTHDMFVISRDNGCLRLPAISCPEGARQMIDVLDGLHTTANAS